MNGRELKVFRARTGLSQEAVAGMFGVTTRTVINWEQGETPPAVLLAVRYLDEHPDELARRAGEAREHAHVDTAIKALRKSTSPVAAYVIDLLIGRRLPGGSE